MLDTETHRRITRGQGQGLNRDSHGYGPSLGYCPPATAPALHNWKLTYDAHHNVTQNEEKEEDTTDDICAAPGEEEGRLWRRELEEAESGHWQISFF